MKIKECPLCDKERLILVLRKKAGDCPGCFEKNDKDEIVLKKPCGKCKYRDNNISLTRGIPWPYSPNVPATPAPQPWPYSPPAKWWTTTTTTTTTLATGTTYWYPQNTGSYSSSDLQMSMPQLDYQQQALMNADPFSSGTK